MTETADKPRLTLKQFADEVVTPTMLRHVGLTDTPHSRNVLDLYVKSLIEQDARRD